MITYCSRELYSVLAEPVILLSKPYLDINCKEINLYETNILFQTKFFAVVWTNDDTAGKAAMVPKKTMKPAHHSVLV